RDVAAREGQAGGLIARLGLNAVFDHIDRNVKDLIFVHAEALGPAERDIERALPLDHFRERFSTDGGGQCVLDVGDANVPFSSLFTIDGEFQIRLAQDAEHAHVLNAADLADLASRAIGDAFQLLQIGTDDLNRVFTFD